MKKRSKRYACMLHEEDTLVESTELACETMRHKRWSVEKLARKLKMTPRRLKGILNGRREMTLREYARLTFNSRSELIETPPGTIPGLTELLDN